MAGWLEVFGQIVEVDTLLLPAPLPASLALLRSLRGREREGGRERETSRAKSPSRHGPPAAAVGSSRGMTTVHMVINSSQRG